VYHYLELIFLSLDSGVYGLRSSTDHGRIAPPPQPIGIGEPTKWKDGGTNGSTMEVRMDGVG